MKKRRMNPYLTAGLVITGLMLAVILVGIFWTPYSPTAMKYGRFQPPSAAHLFGTDNFGRDIFSRVLKGSGTTLAIALSTVSIGAVVGTLVGAVTGYFGGWVDEALMRLNDALTAFPSILLALVLIAIFGSGKYNIILALGILFVPSFARIVRTEVAKQKSLDYVRSARLMGVGDMRILFVHIMPNILSVILVNVALSFATCMLYESSLSYLGFGIIPPTPTWGNMLTGCNNSVVIQQYWWR